MSVESFDVMFTTKVTVEIDTALFTREERDKFRYGFYKGLDLKGHACIIADAVMQRDNPCYIWDYGMIAYDEYEPEFQVGYPKEFKGIRVRRYEADLLENNPEERENQCQP